MAADDQEVVQPQKGALRLVDPSSLSARSSMVGLRTAKHPSDVEYEDILASLAARQLRRNAVFVTGVQGGDGTTTTAANLAGALRRRDASVVLIELRMTVPGLLRMLGDPSHVVGLEEGLRGKTPLDECLFKLGEGNLQVMAVKTPMSEDEAAQQSGALNDLLVWAENQFDWVVLDCPPVTSPDWTRWFMLNADPVLLVTRAGGTRMTDLKKVAGALTDHLAGVILNCSDRGL
jgi:Mrp family chromosome partitioning ATPase